MKKALIGGVYYGAHNVGDEAILSSMINSFQNKSDLSVSTYDNNWILKKYKNVTTYNITTKYSKPKLGLYSLPRKNVFKSIRNIYKDKKFYSKSDLFICGGATILSDCPWYSLRTIQLAKSVNTPAILFSVGMAEVKDAETLAYIKRVCNSIEDIFVRDEYVKERLIDNGIQKEKIKICYDAALMLTPNDNFKIEQYLSNKETELYNDQNINIAITLSGEKDIKDKTPTQDIKVLINSWIKDYNANIFLIPTNTRKGQDVDLMHDLVINDKVTLIKDEFSPEDLISFMGNFSFVLSSRLHMNILSSITGIPSIGLVRNEKIIDFSNLLDLKYFDIDNKLDINGISKYAGELIENNINIKDKITAKVSLMRKEYQKCVDYIISKYL